MLLERTVVIALGKLIHTRYNNNKRLVTDKVMESARHF